MNDSEMAKLAAGGAEVAVRRMVYQAAQLDTTFPDDYVDDPDTSRLKWLTEIQGVIILSGGLEEGMSTVKAVGLAVANRHWSDLPVSFRKQFREDFYSWAMAHTDKARSTIENHIRAVETFIFSASQPHGKVRIPQRDDHKRIVYKDKEPQMIEVDWDPLKVPLGKLVLIRAKAEAKVMTEKLWSMAADPGCTWENLNAELATGGSGVGGAGGVIYRFEGPLLTATENGQTVSLGEMFWEEYYNNPAGLVHRAMNRLMLIMNIPEEDKIILQDQRREDNHVYDAD